MPLTEFESRITAAVDRLSKSVVTIRSRRLVNEFPFGAIPVQGSGSGFIIDQSGRIVTNYHVVLGSSKVEVTLSDGSTFVGTIIGGDRATDLALIKIDGKDLPAVSLGDSEELKVGQTALALGNALDLPGNRPTISVGVISALGRPLPWADFIFEGLIQTDAPINPGNSGGPLADSDGNVIGMNTAIIQSAQGVGFAIPINTIKWVIEQINEKGHVPRPILGVSVITITPTIAKQLNLIRDSGVLVAAVAQNSPAHHAGLQGGDILESISTYRLSTIKDLLVALSKLPVNEDIGLRFLRGNRQSEIKIRLVEGQIN